MPSTNPYEILGISSDAPPRQIRLAYLLLSLEAHPDRGGSHAKMVAINGAWEELSGLCMTDECCDDDGATEKESDSFESDSDRLAESGDESYVGDDNMNFDVYYDYGNLDETGGNYKIQLADGIEVDLEEHEQFCGCGCEEGFSDSDLSSWDADELSELELSEPEM